jgi:hypothetical protein
MMRIAIVAVIAAMVAPAMAALPPQYQRQSELLTVIGSMEVVDAVGEIDRVELIEWDLYRVTGGGCHVDVKIVDVPRKPGEEEVAGPRVFTIAVGDVVCE